MARELDPSFPIEPGARTVNVVYRVNMRDPSAYFWARRFPVRNKDILYVATAPLNDVQKAMSVLSSVTNPALTAISVCGTRC